MREKCWGVCPNLLLDPKKDGERNEPLCDIAIC